MILAVALCCPPFVDTDFRPMIQWYIPVSLIIDFTYAKTNCIAREYEFPQGCERAWVGNWESPRDGYIQTRSALFTKASWIFHCREIQSCLVVRTHPNEVCLPNLRPKKNFVYSATASELQIQSDWLVQNRVLNLLSHFLSEHRYYKLTERSICIGMNRAGLDYHERFVKFSEHWAHACISDLLGFKVSGNGYL